MYETPHGLLPCEGKFIPLMAPASPYQGEVLLKVPHLNSQGQSSIAGALGRSRLRFTSGRALASRHEDSDRVP